MCEIITLFTIYCNALTVYIYIFRFYINRYVLVVIDQFTKWEVYAIPDQDAVTTAIFLVDNFLSRCVAPLEFHTGQGRNCDRQLLNE
jgi:hypothetical protein